MLPGRGSLGGDGALRREAVGMPRGWEHGANAGCTPQTATLMVRESRLGRRKSCAPGGRGLWR